MNQQKYSWAPMALVALAGFLMGMTGLADPDLGFHLATGREVLLSGKIPSVNVLSFTQPDHVWILHEWLPASIFELIRQSTGPAGLVLLQALLISGTWTLVFVAARRLSGNPWAAAFATALALAAAGSRLNLRPHLFTGLYLAALLVLTTRPWPQLVTKRMGMWIAAMAAVLTLGYQTHAGALFLVLFLGAMMVGSFGDARLRHRDGYGDTEKGQASVYSRGKGILFALVAALLMSAALLAVYHPHGLAVMAVPFQLAGSEELTKHVVEYRAIWEFPVQKLPFFWLFVVALSAALLTQIRTLPAGLIIATAGMLFMAIRHVRVIDSAAIVGAPILALGMAKLMTKASTSANRLLPALFICVALAALTVRYSVLPPGFHYNPRVFGDGIFDYMDSRNLKGHAYLSNGWGGPYLGRFYPEQKVFFDPRFEAYSPEFVTDIYKHIRYGKSGWEALLAQYQVEIVGLKYTTPGEAKLQDNAPNLRQHLAQSKSWMLVYFDDSGELFVRTNGPYQALAMSEGMPGIDPDRMQFFVPPAAVLPVLEHAEKTRPGSYKLFMYLATAAQDAGDVQKAELYKRRASGFRR